MRQLSISGYQLAPFAIRYQIHSSNIRMSSTLFKSIILFNTSRNDEKMYLLQPISSLSSSQSPIPSHLNSEGIHLSELTHLNSLGSQPVLSIIYCKLLQQ